MIRVIWWKLEDEIRCRLAARLRWVARRLDGLPIQFIGPVNGENGRMGSKPRPRSRH